MAIAALAALAFYVEPVLHAAYVAGTGGVVPDVDLSRQVKVTGGAF